MARLRRSSEQTLALKIELAQEKVARTREAHEKAVDELKKLQDIQKERQKGILLKAMENSTHTFDEIIAFISSPTAADDELCTE